MFATQSLAAAGAPAAGEVPRAAGGACDGREQIRQQLVEIGCYTADNAADAASRLTAEDLEVLLANPEMMQAAGGASAQVEMTIGVLLVVGLIVGLAVAGGSVVVISTV
jgi:hypothetical protein